MTSDFSALLASSSKILSSTEQTRNQMIFGGGYPNGFNSNTAGSNQNSSTSTNNTTMPMSTTNMKRSLRELSIASATLGLGSGTGGIQLKDGSTTTTTTPMSNKNINNFAGTEIRAQQLLAREGGGFDTARLGRSARKLELMGSFATSTTTTTATTTEVNENGDSIMAHTPYGVRSGLLRNTMAEDREIPMDGASGSEALAIANGIDPAFGAAKGEDLETYLKRRHDQMLSSILTKQRQDTYQTAENLIRKRMEREFQKDSDMILRDLAGYRIHQPSTATDDFNMNITNIHNSQFDTNHTDSNLIMEQSYHPNIQQMSSTASVAAAYGAGSKLSESSRRHASIIATLNARSKQIHNANHQQLINELLNDMYNLASSLNTTSNTASNHTYLNAIQLIQSIVQHDQFSKQLLSNTHNNDHTNMELVAKHRAEGILAHLCHQFRLHIIDEVRSADLSGHLFQSTAKLNLTGFAKTISSYVELKMSLGMSNAAMASSLLWTKLYFCLRCGDALAAREILQNVNTNEPEQSLLLSSINTLAEHQSTHGGSSLWDVSEKKTNPSIPSSITSKLKKQLTDVCMRVRARSSSSPTNNTNFREDYKLSVLTLLSLVEMPESIMSIGVVNTIEDYLFCTLWDAVQNTETTGTSDYTMTPTNNSPSLVYFDKITKLGTSIKRWGPEHFQTDKDITGWSYAMPLLAAQQFQTAIVHLADLGSQRKDGLIHPTHLAIALHATDVAMEDLLKDNQNEIEGASSQLLSKLLIPYSSTFQNVDPEAALEYLVRIPDRVRKDTVGMLITKVGKEARKSIIRLILDTRAFELLAGTISPDGSRTEVDTRVDGRGGGALDAHFSPSDVSSILAGASEVAMRDGNMNDAAELLALAGRFGDLLSLMNKQLGSLLVVDDEQQGHEREFWKNTSHQFYKAYLERGRTRVQEVLEAEDNISLLSTFHLLLNLMEFFTRCADENWEEAWTIVDQLQLIPQSENDMSYRIESYHSMDGSIKNSFHHVVLAAMESLYHQYIKFKSNPGLDTSFSSAIDQRLNELKQRSRLLVMFASLIQMHNSGNVYARITQMEAYMI